MREKVGLLILLILVMEGCAGPVERELARTTSIDQSLDAVLIAEMYGGAAGSVRYSVYIVPKGHTEKYKNEDRVFEASGLEGGELSWSDKNTLEIRYRAARILHFRNYFVKKGREREKSIVIREIPLTHHRHSNNTDSIEQQ